MWPSPDDGANWDAARYGTPDVIFLARIGEAGNSADIRARLARARAEGTTDGWIPAEQTDNVVDDFDAGKQDALAAAAQADAERIGVPEGLQGALGTF